MVRHEDRRGLDVVKIMGATGVMAATVASLVVLAINYGVAKGEATTRLSQTEKDVKELKEGEKKTRGDIDEIKRTLIRMDGNIKILLEEKKKKKNSGG
jgi:peptidoglycan hydrolase CwlO-like protein